MFAQEYEAAFVTEFGARFKPPLRYEASELPRDGFTEATGCDFAYTSKAGDWTVFIRGRMADGILYLTNAYRAQDDINTWIDRLQGEVAPFAFVGGQEKGIADVLKRQGVHVRTKPAVADKLARAHDVIGAWNRGDVRIPTEAPWLDDILPEILAFTGDQKRDEHDDAVDALAALHHAIARKPAVDIGVTGMNSPSTWR